jgi:carboxyl-terminal processing protease
VEIIDRPDARRESDLRGALDTPGDNGAGGNGAANDNQPADADATEAEQAAAQLNEDYQLSRAVDLLRGLTLFNKRVN